MSKFTRPPIVLEYRKPYNPITNHKGGVLITFDSEKYPIGREFVKQIDKRKHKYKVIEHRYIGSQIVAIILDDNF